MTNRVVVIALGVAAFLLLPRGETALAADQVAQVAYKGSGKAGHRYRRDRTMELHSYKGRPIGGYSYKNSDVVNTYGRSPPPWLDVRQSPGGPFDSGFFFDSGISRGNNAPYPR